MNFVIILALVALISDHAKAGCTGNGSKSCGYDFLRLPERIKPLQYDLSITPNLEQNSFTGVVDIKIQVVAPTTSHKKSLKSLLRFPESGDKQIVLNADRRILSIVEESIRYTEVGKTKAVPVSNFCYDENSKNIIIILNKKLAEGSKGTLHLEFSGRIQQNARGLFRDDQFDLDGSKSGLILTQFGPSKAREMFPCFDEPGFKATFKLSVYLPTSLDVISNTDLISVSADPVNTHHSTVSFDETPLMLSNSLALAIGKFDRVQQTASNGRVRVKVYTPIGRPDEGKFMLNVACKALEELEKFFVTPYPLDKLDLISSPNYENRGADSLGLIMMPNSVLLMNEETSVEQLQVGISILLKTLINHWLGNMAAMKRWSDLPLKDSLATWLSGNMTDNIFPEYEVELSTNLALQKAKENDVDIKILSNEPDSAEAVEKYYTSGTSIKGASIIGMLRNYMHPQHFDNALRHYLGNVIHKSTELSDFIGSMSKFTDLPVREIFEPLFTTKGHPLFQVDYVPATNSLRIRQETYPEFRDIRYDSWKMPMTAIVSNHRGREEEIEFVVMSPDESIKLPDWFATSEEGNFVKVNKNGAGFFHVMYSYDLFERLLGAVAKDRLSLLDKVDLITSTKALAIRRRQGVNDLSNLFQALGGKDPIVVRLMRDNSSPDQKSMVLRFQQQLFTDHGFGEPKSMGTNQKLNYAMCLQDLIMADYQPVAEAALKIFDSGLHMIPSAQKDVVYLAVAKFGDDKQFIKLLEMARSSKSAQEKLTVYDCASFTDRPRLLKSLMAALDSDPAKFEGKERILSDIERKISARNI